MARYHRKRGSLEANSGLPVWAEALLVRRPRARCSAAGARLPRKADEGVGGGVSLPLLFLQVSIAGQPAGVESARARIRVTALISGVMHARSPY